MYVYRGSVKWTNQFQAFHKYYTESEKQRHETYKCTIRNIMSIQLANKG